MKFSKAITVTFMSNIIILGLGVIANVIISRCLGPIGKGTLGLSNNIVALFLIIVDLGVGVSNTYFIGKYKNYTDSILGNNLIIAIIECIIVSILYGLEVYFHLSIFKGLTTPILTASLMIIPLSSLKSALINIVLGLEEYGQYNKLNLFYQIINIIILSLFFMFIKSAIYVLVANIITIFIIIIYLLVFIIYKKRVRISFNLGMLKSMVQYGVKIQLSNLVQLITYRLDIFIINYYLSITEVGLYSNAVILAEMMWQIPGTISTLIYPTVSNCEDKEYISYITNKTMRISIVVVSICSILFAIVCKPLILLLFGHEFVGASNALLLLIPAIPFFSISKILASSIAGLGRIDINLKVSGIVCIITVIIDLILIPSMGINGASIASSLTYILHSLITLVYYKKLMSCNVREILLIDRHEIIEIRKLIVEKIKKDKTIENLC